MCGRFTLTSDMDILLYRFAVGMPADFNYLPRYNIAPTQPVLGVVYENEQKTLKNFRWGLIPSWAKDMKFGSKMINARSETLSEKPVQAPSQKAALVDRSGRFLRMDPNLNTKTASLH